MSLTDAQIQAIGEWADNGAVEGDPADDDSAPAAETAGFEAWDFEGAAAQPISVSSGSDRFICIVIDPELEDDTWLRGIE